MNVELYKTNDWFTSWQMCSQGYEKVTNDCKWNRAIKEAWKRFVDIDPRFRPRHSKLNFKENKSFLRHCRRL
jgi:hypothetical protein